jgi:serine phosphatase RsbU (regulator of sigma subunit)
MPSLNLKAVAGPRSASYPALAALCSALAPGALSITDLNNKPLLGTIADESLSTQTRVPVTIGDETIGFVIGPAAAVGPVALLLSHLAARERESRALAAEVLHLYREVHLIEQLSEQLAALLDLNAISEAALAQAKRLIPATHGCILAESKVAGALQTSASFGPSTADSFGPLAATSQFAGSILERGIAEIVNDCHADARALESERALNALICAPLRAGKRSVGVIALANANPGASYSTADLKLLNTIALQTAAAIENSFLAAEMVDAVRDREKLAALQQELDTARTIQHLLVPRVFPPFPERTEFDLHAQMTSARAVGGDFFDFFLVDEDHIGVVIGDVSGKGIPAALYMALTRMQVKTTAIQGMSPAACFLDVNRVLVRERVNAMFATCFYGLLDLRTGELRYCSAGHNPPYILRAGRSAVEPLSEVGGIPLGLFDGMGYLDSIAHLHPGDALFLYTDGVSEAQNITEDDFSDDRVIATLTQSPATTCQELIADMARRVAAFTNGAPQSDDITMLTLRRL